MNLRSNVCAGKTKIISCKGHSIGELVALAGFYSPGFPQVALAKICDWLMEWTGLKFTTRDSRHF